MGDQVKAVATPWAEPWNHRAVCVNMDALLSELGVSESHVRRRLTAHAIVASGWRQAIWHFNAWGVKRASWSGPWYVMPTDEEIKGETVHFKGGKVAQWRAFSGWREAFDDTIARLQRSPGRLQALYDASADDSDYWKASGAAKYYTDTRNMTPERFGKLCGRVRLEIESATPDEIAAAAAFARTEVGGIENARPFHFSGS